MEKVMLLHITVMSSNFINESQFKHFKILRWPKSQQRKAFFFNEIVFIHLRDKQVHTIT
jgi:hypothetical protein